MTFGKGFGKDALIKKITDALDELVTTDDLGLSSIFVSTEHGHEITATGPAKIVTIDKAGVYSKSLIIDISKDSTTRTAVQK